MADRQTGLKQLRRVGGVLLAAPLLAQCTMADLDSLRQIPVDQPANGAPAMNGAMPIPQQSQMPVQQPMPAANGQYGGPMPGQGPTTPMGGQSIGSGPVRVALLLPLSGDARQASVGRSMANGAKLAMEFIAGNPNIADNITLTVMDTHGSAAGAANAASAAISGGASAIIGPLAGDEVVAAGSAARAAGVPLIGFSNTESAAGPGVYLLSVLPSVEVKRSLTYAKGQGRRSVAAIVPAGAFGEAQLTALKEASAKLGLSPKAIYTFNGSADIRRVVEQIAPQLKSGEIDTLFIPDRASAPAIAGQLTAAGISPARLTVIGSADWQGDVAIAGTQFLDGAIYPAVDEAGLNAIRPGYTAEFGSEPHPLATIAYTATILVNASPLSMAPVKYNPAVLTAASGFNGRDGVFRFLPDGRADYALVIKKVTGGGAVTVDGPKL